ncbi:MAG: NAD(P)H-binding protein [Burkholderiales bacterium]
MQRRAFVAGSTGLVGRELVQRLLDDPDTIEVVAVTRRPLAIPHPKLTEALVDFEHLQDIAAPPVDDYYCCLGTTMRQAGSEDAFREADLIYPVTLAHIALAAGATRCFVVSAMGANPASRVFYNRIKGELEAELARLPFQTVVALRPSLLAGDRDEFRAGERVALAVMRPLRALVPARYRAIPAATVARALVAASRSPAAGRFVIESDAIARLAASERGDSMPGP